MTKQHIHKYRRIDIGRDVPFWVMQCSEPGCNHYVQMKSKKTCPRLVGKVALCNSCGDRFILNRRSLKLAKPNCEACVKPANEKGLKKVNEFFKLLEGELVDDAS